MKKTERNYNAVVKNSSKELSKREKLKITTLSDAQSLEEPVNVAKENAVDFIITPAQWAIVDIHNERSKGAKDYTTLVIIDKDGFKYKTSSDSFINAFIDIWDGMTEDGSEEEFEIKIFGLPAKNYSGKYFLTCAII